jgi:hypothetical protein
MWNAARVPLRVHALGSPSPAVEDHRAAGVPLPWSQCVVRTLESVGLVQTGLEPPAPSLTVSGGRRVTLVQRATEA